MLLFVMPPPRRERVAPPEMLITNAPAVPLNVRLLMSKLMSTVFATSIVPAMTMLAVPPTLTGTPSGFQLAAVFQVTTPPATPPPSQVWPAVGMTKKPPNNKPASKKRATMAPPTEKNGYDWQAQGGNSKPRPHEM